VLDVKLKIGLDGAADGKIVSSTTTAAAGAGLKRSLGILGECFLAIHTLIVLISRFDRIFRK
jgi:hypothetical protein